MEGELTRSFEKLVVGEGARRARSSPARSSSASEVLWPWEDEYGGVQDDDGGGDWTTVSNNKNSSSFPSSGSEMEPIIVSLNCPFKIYQRPKYVGSEEAILQLVNTVVATGADTMQLFLDVVANDDFNIKGPVETRKQLILMRGVPGSGKSSVANALMAVTRRGKVCSADNFFMDRQGNYIFNHGLLGDAHSACQVNCRKLIERGVSPVIIDNTNTKRFEMEPYVKMAIEHYYIVTLFQPETTWKYDAKELAQKTVHQVPKKKIQEMLDRFEQVMPYNLVYDVAKCLGEKGKRYLNNIPTLPKAKTPPPLPPPRFERSRSSSGGYTKNNIQKTNYNWGSGNLSCTIPTPTIPPFKTPSIPTPSIRKRQQYGTPPPPNALLLSDFVPKSLANGNGGLDSSRSWTPEEEEPVAYSTVAGYSGRSSSARSVSVASSSVYSVNNDNSPPPNDGPDWFDLTLSKNIITKLSELYGDADDPRVVALLREEGVRARIPPDMAFEMFSALVQKVDAKITKAAEEAAQD